MQRQLQNFSYIIFYEIISKKTSSFIPLLEFPFSSYHRSIQKRKSLREKHSGRIDSFESWNNRFPRQLSRFVHRDVDQSREREGRSEVPSGGNPRRFVRGWGGGLTGNAVGNFRQASKSGRIEWQLVLLWPEYRENGEWNERVCIRVKETMDREETL